LLVTPDEFASPKDMRRNAMKIRTAIALAALAVTPAFAGDAAAARVATDETMTVTEKATVESLQKEIAMLEKAVEQVRQASAERALVQAKQQAEANNHPLWP
jgi:cell division protein FtsB